MSRLENRAKAGFFPTPGQVIPILASHLAPPREGAYRALDPCAGEGVALDEILRAIEGESFSFGIEIDQDRARAAAKRLWKVLGAPVEAVRASAGSFGLLWLNPPYDQDSTQPGRRTEYGFLRRTFDWLAPGGVLVYLIPDYRISPSIARFLSSRCEKIRVFRFPPPSYSGFRQAAILAVKRPTKIVDEETTTRLLSCADGSAPVLEEGDGEYRIPALDETTSFHFHLADVSPEELIAEARASGAWGLRELADVLDPPPPSEVRPLLPLKRGHIAMLLAAGCLGNALLERGGRRILVKGSLAKKSLDRTTEADGENGATRTLETFSATVSTLDLATGEVSVIADEAVLRIWFAEWKEPLLQHLARSARPLHDGDIGSYGLVLDTLSKARRLPGLREAGLFPAQKHVAAAVAKHFARGGRSAVLQATMGTGKTSMAVAVAELLISRRSDGLAP